MNNPIFQIETKAGDLISAGELQIVPFNQVFRVTLPGLNTGLIWNRPTAIWVRLPDGTEQVLKVTDKTREYVIKLLLSGTFGSLIIWIMRRISR